MLLLLVSLCVLILAAYGSQVIGTEPAADTGSEDAALVEARLAEIGAAVVGLGAHRLEEIAEELIDADNPVGAMALLSAAVDQNPNLEGRISRADAVGARYQFIPAGIFGMGADEDAYWGDDDERPARSVYLDGYYIMKTEVTNAHYSRCVAAGGCDPPSNDRWNDPEFAQHPVTQVSWSDGTAYAAWVDGRLPTEAEWEKACRGSDEREFPWGDEWPSDAQMHYHLTKGMTIEVYNNWPGANGLYHMAGNVWEWTADWYDENYYDHAPDRNPPGPATGDYHTVRGGAWGSTNTEHMRCAYRLQNRRGLDADVGFRVVFPGGSVTRLR